MKLEWNVRGGNEECFLAAEKEKKMFQKDKEKSIFQIFAKNISAKIFLQARLKDVSNK